MITETERVIDIIENGARNGLSLADFIDIQIKEFEASPEYKDMLTGENYDNNKTKIDEKKRTYIDMNGAEREAKMLNNSKVKYPVVVKLKRQKTGFLLKQKMTLKEKIEKNEKEDSEYMKTLNKFFNNKKHKLMKNTLNQTIIKGIAWWSLSVNEELELKVKLRYANEIIPIWADREHENLDAIIVRYYNVNYKPDKTKELVEKVEYHDPKGVRFLVRDGQNLIPDIQKIQENSELKIGDDDGNPIFAYFVIDGKCYVWEKIPFVYWKYNEQEHPLIFYIQALVDEIEKLKSAVSDKILDSVDGVDVVKNYSEDAEKFQHNLQTLRTVFIEEDGDYHKEQGSIDIEAFKGTIEQLRKDVYDLGGGVDTESDKFGNQQSGIALQELYNDLDLDCSNIESEYQSSLEYFMFFFNTWQNLVTNKDYSEKEVEFIFNKSMITDDTSKIANIRNSEGIISKKSQLANHPYVKNVEEELEQLKKEEQEEETDDYSNLNDHNDDEDRDADE